VFENNSRLPRNLTGNRQSESLNKSQLTFFSWASGEGGIGVDEDDDDG
jgi:hypothetical protein